MESILLAAIAGFVASAPVSIVKSIPTVAALLKATPWPWGAKLALALAGTGSAGAVAAGVPGNPDAQLGFFVGGLAGAIAYQIFERQGLETLWRSLGSRVNIEVQPKLQVIGWVDASDYNRGVLIVEEGRQKIVPPNYPGLPEADKIPPAPRG